MINAIQMQMTMIPLTNAAAEGTAVKGAAEADSKLFETVLASAAEAVMSMLPQPVIRTEMPEPETETIVQEPVQAVSVEGLTGETITSETITSETITSERSAAESSAVESFRVKKHTADNIDTPKFTKDKIFTTNDSTAAEMPEAVIKRVDVKMPVKTNDKEIRPEFEVVETVASEKPKRFLKVESDKQMKKFQPMTMKQFETDAKVSLNKVIPDKGEAAELFRMDKSSFTKEFPQKTAVKLEITNDAATVMTEAPVIRTAEQVTVAEAKVEAGPVYNQVSEKVTESLKDNKLNFKMKLHPKGLGELTVKMSYREGKVSLDITAGTESTEKLLVSQLGELKSALGTSGSTLSEIRVSSERSMMPTADSGFFGSRADLGAEGERSRHGAFTAGRREYDRAGQEDRMRQAAQIAYFNKGLVNYCI